ncbi:hypothetical protein P9112_009252 [Eukaryota sp. TZLM1-RC]
MGTSTATPLLSRKKRLSLKKHGLADETPQPLAKKSNVSMEEPLSASPEAPESSAPIPLSTSVSDTPPKSPIRKDLFSDSEESEGGTAQTLSDDSSLEDAPLLDDDFGSELSDDDSDMEIEEKAERYAEHVKNVQESAAAELTQDDVSNDIIIFPENEELALSDRSLINERIQSVLKVLADFSAKRDPSKSRVDYLDRLTIDCAAFYEFLPSLLTKFLRIFSPHELITYLEQADSPRPIVIRTNTLKTRRKDLAKALISRGVNLEPIEWSREALVVFESQVPIGATPEYLGGHYMIQSAASLLPVMALDPKPSETVLDVCAAPGGKTTFIAQLMKNKGVVVANDANISRTKGLIGNIHRLGVTSSMVINYDGRKLGQKLGQKFDRILLDAPCSGLGVIDKDPSVKLSRTDDDIKKTSHLQKELIRTAISMVKKDGILVYSTCSITLEENEDVVDYALSLGNVVLEKTGLELGEPGICVNEGKRFDDSVKLCRRFYPHIHNIHGFFVAKFRKL